MNRRWVGDFVWAFVLGAVLAIAFILGIRAVFMWVPTEGMGI
jgi:hypothetical protein